jgi:protein-S-isoprenylcysteine O-methyltransferase Ste14
VAAVRSRVEPAEPVRPPGVDLASSSSPRFTNRRGVDSRALVTYVSAVLLGWLGIAQAGDALREWALFTADPSWTVASMFTRSVLYTAFVTGAAITLLSSKGPQARDARRWVVVASLTATFLMVGVSFLPAGPLLWGTSNRGDEVGLVLSVIGATLALAAFASLGSSFSIAPEVRALVVTGPYRFMRHPIYLAELLMFVGVVVAYPRLTTLVGTLSVLALQIFRIEVEESLLRASFPASFAKFSARTRFRLIPLLW